jgi:flagellar biosynthesis protein FlhA
MAADLAIVTLDPALEQILQQALQSGAEGVAGLEPGLVERLNRALGEIVQRQEAAGQPAVLAVAPNLRPWLARFLRHSHPGLSVLAYSEIPGGRPIRVIATVGR